MLQIPDLKLTHVGNILDWVFLVLPNYSLGTAFNDLYTNDRALETCTRPTVQLYCKLLASNYTEIFHLHLMPNPCCKGVCCVVCVKIEFHIWCENVAVGRCFNRDGPLRVYGLH